MIKKTGILLSLVVVCATVVVYAESPVEDLKEETRNLRSETKQQVQGQDTDTKEVAHVGTDPIREQGEAFQAHRTPVEYFTDEQIQEGQQRIVDVESESDIKGLLRATISEHVSGERGEPSLAEIINEIESMLGASDDAINEHVEAELTAERDEFLTAWMANYLQTTERDAQNLVESKQEEQYSK